MNKADIGARLKKSRKDKGYTQEYIAEKLNVGPTYVSDLERGVKTPSFDLFVNLIELLEVSPDYILSGHVNTSKGYVYDELTKKLENLTPQQRQCVSDIIDAYLRTI